MELTDDTIWEVELVRTETQKVYVECATADEATEAGEQLAESQDWIELDSDTNAIAVNFTPSRYWTGGEQGHWVDA